MSDNWQLKAIISAVDKMSPVLKSIQGVARTTRKHLLDVGNAAAGLGGKLGLPIAALSSVAAGFTLVGIKHQVEALTDSAEDLVNTATRMGTTAEQLQRIKFVAGQSGVEVESLQGAIGKLDKNLALASRGKNQALVNLLKHLHISMRNSNGQLRSGIELLPQISDAFVKYKNHVVRSSMGNTMFSKSYLDLLPVLVEGSDSLQKTTDIYNSLNAEMSSTDLEKAKDLGDKFRIVSVAFESVRNTVIMKLMPALNPLIDKLITWVIANKDIIATKLTTFVTDLVTALQNYDWKGFIDNVKGIWNGFQKLVDWIGGAKNALIALVIVMNAQVITATLGLIGAVARAALAFGGLGVAALFQAVPALTTLQTSLKASGKGVDAMAGKVGLLIGQFQLLAAAAAAGYAVGSWIYDNVVTEKQSDEIGETIAKGLAFFGNDTAQSALNTNRRSPLIASAKTNVAGKIDINFSNAPAGMRVTQNDKPGAVEIAPRVGYRSLGTSGAF